VILDLLCSRGVSRTWEVDAGSALLHALLAGAAIQGRNASDLQLPAGFASETRQGGLSDLVAVVVEKQWTCRGSCTGIKSGKGTSSSWCTGLMSLLRGSPSHKSFFDPVIVSRHVNGCRQALVTKKLTR
jgi:hypothetical protein